MPSRNQVNIYVSTMLYVLYYLETKSMLIIRDITGIGKSILNQFFKSIDHPIFTVHCTFGVETFIRHSKFVIFATSCTRFRRDDLARCICSLKIHKMAHRIVTFPQAMKPRIQCIVQYIWTYELVPKIQNKKQ